MLAPRVIGSNRDKIKHFNLQQEHAVGNALRYPLGRFTFPVDVSFGGVSRRANTMQINDRPGVANSLDKLRCKKLWATNEIPQVNTYHKLSHFVEDGYFMIEKFERTFTYPCVAKLATGERSRGFKYINSYEDLAAFLRDPENKLKNYFFEAKFEFDQEFRIHVSPWLKDFLVGYQFTSLGQQVTKTRRNGAIAIIQKLIKQEFYDRGVRHGNRAGTYDCLVQRNNCNETGLDEVVENAVKAIKVLGLDFGFVDVGRNSTTGEYVFFESGSNPELTTPEIECYKIALRHIILKKAASEGRVKKDFVKAINKSSTIALEASPKVLPIPVGRPRSRNIKL